MSKKCPKCGIEAPDEATKCPGCWTSLREEDVPGAPAGGTTPAVRSDAKAAKAVASMESWAAGMLVLGIVGFAGFAYVGVLVGNSDGTFAVGGSVIQAWTLAVVALVSGAFWRALCRYLAALLDTVRTGRSL